VFGQPVHGEVDGLGELRPAGGHRAGDHPAERRRVRPQRGELVDGGCQQHDIGHARQCVESALTRASDFPAGKLDGVIVAFSVSPSGGDETGGVGAAVAEAVRVVRESGLPNETNAMFTNIEGEWDEVMAVVKQAVEVVSAVSPRVSLVLKADIRPGYTGQLTAKVERIEQALSD
jgi:uncharacterized protein (TIGR00106 family)